MNYRIVAVPGSGLLTAAYVGFSDEADYSAAQYLRGEDDEPLRFDSDDEAVDHLNQHFRLEFIHPDDRRLTPQQVAHMRR